MLDHLLWGVPDLDRGIHDFADATGVRATFGGRHAGVGTHNALLDLEDQRYFEIIAPDPSQDHFSGFGELLRDLERPGLLTWAAHTDDVEALVRRARDTGLEPGEITAMSRRTPSGEVLAWRLVMIGGHPWGPLLPFFIEWQGAAQTKRVAHPSHDAPRGCRLASFALAHPDADALRASLWALGLDTQVREAPAPGLCAEIESPRGVSTFTGSPPGHRTRA